MASSSDSGLQMESSDAVIPPPVIVPPPVQRVRPGPPHPKAQTTKAPPPKPPQATAPPAAEPATAGETTENQDSEAAAPLFSLRSSPSWLVSLSVHLVLLILLALFTVVSQPKLVATIFTSGFETDVPLETVQELTLDPIEDVETVSQDVGSGEALTTEVMEIGGGEAAAVAIGASDLQLDSVSEVGGLFTGDGPAMKDSGMTALKGAEFFGVKASGKKFVFVVDSSNSMKNGKFDAAKEELEYAIRRLSSEQLFYVVFFDQDAEKMLLPPDDEPPTNVVPATGKTINMFVKWMGTVKNEAKTNPYEAVKFALELKPDAIYILSDGKFTHGGRTVRFLKEENVLDDPINGRRPRAIIHTIAFWQRDGEEAMKDIAETHKGTYRFVPPGKK